MSSYLFHHHLHGVAGGAYGGTVTPTIGAALDEMMCGKSDGNLSSASSNVSPNSMFFSSILMRDLNLSEDSDAEPTVPEDTKTSASQSKKGKVIASTAGAPVKRAVSPLSSSSNNSSSDSSSESDGDDDDDDDDDEGDDKEKKGMEGEGEAKRISERRMSSSGSNTSSDSSSESGSDDEDEDEDARKLLAADTKPSSADKGDKFSSPPYGKGMAGPASVGTPGTVVQESSEASMSWRLDNFIHPSKRNSNSPANQSPFKTGSPSVSFSAPPSVQPKEEVTSQTPDSSRPRPLKDIGQSDTMPFDLVSHKHSVDQDSDHNADGEDDDDDEEVFKETHKHSSYKESKPIGPPPYSALASKIRKSSSSFAEEKTQKSGPKENQPSSGSLGPPLKDSSGKDVLGKLESFRKDIKQEISPPAGTRHDKSKTRPSGNKKKSSKTGSSSDDEIDVVGYTPDEKHQDHLIGSFCKAVSSKGREEVSKTLFDDDVTGAVSVSSDHMSSPRGKNAPNHHIKHHRRKRNGGEPNSSSASISSTSHESSSTTTIFTSTTTSATTNITTASLSKSGKKLPGDEAGALDHLESMSQPPNLLLPGDSSISPSPGASTKPLPPFRTSFLSAPKLSSANIPAIVTLNRNADGSSKPRILVQIGNSFMSEKTIRRMKEKREKRNNGGKSSSKTDSKPVEFSIKSESHSDTSSTVKESRVPPIPGKKSSAPSSGSHNSSTNSNSIKDTRESVSTSNSAITTTSSSSSASSSASKASKRKSHEAPGSGNEETSTPYKIPKHNKPSSKEAASSSSTSETTASCKNSSSSSSSHNLDPLTNSAAAVALTSSYSKSTKLTSPNADSITTGITNKASGSSSANNPCVTDGIQMISNGASKSEKVKPSKKRRPESDEESGPKRTKNESTPDLSSGASVLTAATVRKRRDSAASSSSKDSRKSKKLRRSSTASNKSATSSSNNNNNNNIEKTNGPDSGNLPFNHYVNGNSGNNSNSDVPAAAATATISTTTTTTSSSSSSTTGNSNAAAARGSSSTSSASSSLPPHLPLPSNLPLPSPIETQLASPEHYLARAREHKHHADNLKDKPAKFEPYLRSGLSFFLAGYSMEQGKKGTNASNNMYNETSNLLKCVIRMKTSNPESSDRERKLIVLMIRLQAYLNHRIYRLRNLEVSKLKRVIDGEQSKLHSSSSATATTSSSTSQSGSKPHAPSPHQSSWNKNSTGTPSPMSPTPSPAGSVSSQGSCEHVSGKIPNGTASASSTPMTSPSPGMVSVHQRFQKYFTLTSFVVKALELWDQADAESRGLEEFFSIIDNACGPLSFHSEPLVIVRYMKDALRLLNL